MPEKISWRTVPDSELACHCLWYIRLNIPLTRTPTRRHAGIGTTIMRARTGSLIMRIAKTAIIRNDCCIRFGASTVMNLSIIDVSHVTVLISSPDDRRERVLTDIFSILSKTVRRRSTTRRTPASITERLRREFITYPERPSPAIRQIVRAKPRKTAPPSPPATAAFAVSLSIYPSTSRRLTYGPSRLTANPAKNRRTDKTMYFRYGRAMPSVLFRTEPLSAQFTHVFIPGRRRLPHFGQTRSAPSSPSVGYFPVSRKRTIRRTFFAITSEHLSVPRQTITGPPSVEATISQAPTRVINSSSAASEKRTERTKDPRS